MVIGGAGGVGGFGGVGVVVVVVGGGVWVFVVCILKGAHPFVVWWCWWCWWGWLGWCVGGVLHGALPLVVWCVGADVLVSMYVCVDWDRCPHGGLVWWCDGGLVIGGDW